MTLLHKLSGIKYLICFFCIVLGTSVNAQFAILKSGKPKANFTSFTPVKTYDNLTKLNALTPLQYRTNPDYGKCFTDSTQWYEEINKRTLKTRTYKGPGSEVIVESGYDNLNYVDADGWYRAVDIKLKPCGIGWAAVQQENPVYLYTDASTALSLGGGALMIFNKNVEFNGSDISTSDYSVGDDGMYVKNAAQGTDKIIRFGRGKIITDYRISHPLQLNADLSIGEDIILPAGYSISENDNYDPDIEKRGSLVVKDVAGNVVAEIKAPFCFDNSKNSIVGAYSFQKQASGYRLEITIPRTWLNDAARHYPVTVDPAVVCPQVEWNGGRINSCFDAQLEQPADAMDTGSLLVPVYGGITITNFYPEGSYYTTTIKEDQGRMWFWTACGDSVYSDPPPIDSNDVGGQVELVPGQDFLSFVPGFLCCIKPSLKLQFFKFYMALVRDSGGSGCNQNYMFYDPDNYDNFDQGQNPYPFEAYVVGHTVEGTYSLPDSICSSVCTLKMAVNVDYGLPPYTVTDPWSKDTITFGDYSTDSCTSTGMDTITISIPNCGKATECTSSSLKIPPPKIVDAYGNSVGGLDSQTVILKASPNVLATPDSQTVCSGTTISIALGSCAGSATYTWISSEGMSGAGTPIVNTPNNNTANTLTVNYFVTPMANGCAGTTTTFPVKVTPFTVIVTPPGKALCEGDSVSLAVTGDATTYSWSPAAGLSCTTCSNPVADPTVTTTYTVVGTNGGSCMATNSIKVSVNPKLTLAIAPPSPVICDGQNVTLLVTGGGVNYTWSPSLGLNVTTGDSVIANPTATITYTVMDADTNSCGETDSVTVTVIPSPNKPSFRQHGDTLISSSKHDNQWYRNDTALLDDTSQYLIITALGEYWVNVNNEVNGCSTASDSVNITVINGIDLLPGISDQVSIYPNPFNNELFIKINSPADDVGSWGMQLTDVLGRTVYSMTPLNPLKGTFEIDLSNLATGVYFITIMNDTGRAVFPVVRQN